MHKFDLKPCRVQNGDENSYNGTVVIMSATAIEDLMLFFPISEDNASLINFVLDKENKENININQDIVGIYKTMIDSWKASDKFVSGIVIDTRFIQSINEDILEAYIAIIDSDGNLDAFVKTSFTHAIVVAAMEDLKITITDELFKKLYPKSEENSNDDNIDNADDDDSGGDTKNDSTPPNISPIKTTNDKLPFDKDIIAIAKKIISGNISEK